jgi:hypothetical protein
MIHVPCCQLQPGDILQPTAREVLRVIHDGAFERNSDDTRSRRPWPKGKVEIMVRDRYGRSTVHYYGKWTRVNVQRG